MKPGFSNISSMPLIECFSLLWFHHSVDVLLLFSSVHSSIHNSNQENTQHLFPVCLYLLLRIFVISFICTQDSGEQMVYDKNIKYFGVTDMPISMIWSFLLSRIH